MTCCHGKWHLESKTWALAVLTTVETLLPPHAHAHAYAHTRTLLTFPYPTCQAATSPPSEESLLPLNRLGHPRTPLGMSSLALGLWPPALARPALHSPPLCSAPPPDSRTELFGKGKEQEPSLTSAENTCFVNHALHVGSTCNRPVK